MIGEPRRINRPTIIAGLYGPVRNGYPLGQAKTLDEIPTSLDLNPRYSKELVILAGDGQSADDLRRFGLRAHRVFDDAPPAICKDSLHLMKHWMILWAVRHFGEVLWVDWDTVCLRWPDEEFWDWCRRFDTPKFVWVPEYWATVNCGVCYVNESWAETMERSFSATVSEPNDELLWRSVLPTDVRGRPEFWFGDRVAHVWTEHSFRRVTPRTSFVHIRDFSLAPRLRTAVGLDGDRPGHHHGN